MATVHVGTDTAVSRGLLAAHDTAAGVIMAVSSSHQVHLQVAFPAVVSEMEKNLFTLS